MNARYLEIVLKPRTLVDDIEDDIMHDYERYVNNVKRQVGVIQKEINEILTKITNTKDKLKNPKLSSTEIKKLNTDLETEKNKYKSECDKKQPLDDLLPPNTQSVAGNRQRARYLRWKWALKYKIDNVRIGKLVKKITENYNNKPNDFKRDTSLESYKDQFCTAMAKLHEDASRRVAHAVAEISLEEGKEFEKIRAYGDDLDEYITILVNAVGLRLPKAKTADEMFKVRTIKKHRT